MKLDEFDGAFFSVLKNGTFDTLGNYVSTPGKPFLSYAADESYLKRACTKEDISCIICTQELSEKEILHNYEGGIAVADNPRLAFNKFNNWLANNNNSYINNYGDSIIPPGCKIHSSAIIAPKGVVIGNNCVIEEFVSIKEGVTIGDNVVIRSGAVIGVPANIVVRDEGHQFLIKQLGRVVIHNDVTIGCNVHIARGSFPYESTKIGEYTSIDNNSEIGHNVKIGKNCIITGQTQICGNSILEDDTRLNPMSIVSNRIHISEGCTIDIGSVVVNNLKKGERVAGNFAIPHERFLLWHRNKLRKN